MRACSWPLLTLMQDDAMCPRLSTCTCCTGTASAASQEGYPSSMALSAQHHSPPTCAMRLRPPSHSPPIPQHATLSLSPPSLLRPHAAGTGQSSVSVSVSSLTPSRRSACSGMAAGVLVVLVQFVGRRKGAQGACQLSCFQHAGWYEGPSCKRGALKGHCLRLTSDC